MTLLKIPYQSAQDILDLYTPEVSFSQLANKKMLPLELIEIAFENELYAEAVMYLAHALPLRETIWWAYCCAHSRDDWNEAEANAIRAAKAWVHIPDEASRRFAEAMANKSGLESGAGWAAQAAFWSGGSITQPDDPIVPPPPYLYAQAAAGCISLTAILPDGSKAKKRYRQFIDIALHIAKGGNGQI
ncbi:Twin-arginine translocation pathway signal [Shewanella psychropiezotolerans]|uniref:Twin-arginine translocation pathway signal n=1 Tax=Shewanella psychropiezotolerans TaxID=2593655 RepID=A0ABX5WW73_9GAMM|nr:MULTISPECIES: Twin-arginine translocation pathway signal [Shewanella]MPY22321.1 Twin-arginine translocation pathway signal [Shewanella sp. YLB-07]QDO83345.1 Twin-arginine translocation pathway signal [Shewanella psychropiezotolerans]